MNSIPNKTAIFIWTTSLINAIGVDLKSSITGITRHIFCRGRAVGMMQPCLLNMINKFL